MDDLPEESLEKYPPAWSDYDWTDYDQEDFDDYVRSKWLPVRFLTNK